MNNVTIAVIVGCALAVMALASGNGRGIEKAVNMIVWLLVIAAILVIGTGVLGLGIMAQRI